MTINNSLFIESVFEIAFGDDAINKGFSETEVLEKLRQFSDLALKAENNNDMSFTLYDEATGDEVEGSADAKSDLGVSLYFEGYGDMTSQDDCGTPVYIEKYDGELKVRIYGDINSEEPTHNISLEGALLSKRKLDEEASCNSSLEPYEGEIRVGLWPVNEGE